MKQLWYTLSLLIISLGAFAQAKVPYGNEWVSPGLPYFKFKILEEGMYRIDFQTLVDAGVPVDQGIVKGSDFQIIGRGDTVPFYVSAGTNIFGVNDYIQIYCLPNDGWFEENLYFDREKNIQRPDWHGNPHYSFYTDTSVYYLTYLDGLGTRQIKPDTNDLNNPPPATEWCYSKVLYAPNEVYWEGYYEAVDGHRVFTSDYGPGEGIALESSISGTSPFSYNFSTPNYNNPDNVDSKIEVSMTSQNKKDHHIKITVNNSVNVFDSAYTGYKIHKPVKFFNIPLGATTSLEITPLAGKKDKNKFFFAELEYPMAMDANGKKLFKFEMDNDTEKYIEISNFDHGNEIPLLFDLTNDLRIRAQFNGSKLRYRIPAPSTTDQRRKFIVISQAAGVISDIDSLQEIQFIDFNHPSNQGDYIIVTHSKLLNAATDYANYRASTGKSPLVVNIAQIYDQFGHGIRNHPGGLKNFANFAADSFSVKPENMFLIGKGAVFFIQKKSARSFRATGDNYFYARSCLIPTYGIPASDNMLTSAYGSMTPRIAVGRLAATNETEVQTFLNKVIQYENAQTVDSLNNLIADKIWQKEIMHFGGGDDEQQQNLFKAYLDRYEDIIDDTLFGGRVSSYFKTSASAIQLAVSDIILNRVNKGVSLMTFFGHSSANGFDFSLDDPSNYDNTGRYPLIIANGCYSGMIHDLYNYGISEDFVLTPNKGAIGFISSSALGLTTSLHSWTRIFYTRLGLNHYNTSVGNILNETIETHEDVLINYFNDVACQQMNYHGDPAILLNTYSKPDYAIESDFVYTNPQTVTAELDSFQVVVVLHNIGKSTADSITVSATRTFPAISGKGDLVLVKRILAPKSVDTIYFTYLIDPKTDFGFNDVAIKIDYNEEISELSETNNELNLPVNIRSDDILPIEPINFGIVGDANALVLKASTVDAFAPSHDYLIQIDTSEEFSNPLDSARITQIGGVLEWTPSTNLNTQTVYYWRVKYDNPNYTWHNSSFIYISGSPAGWNQSHYYQFKKDDYTNIQLDSNRVFNFFDDVKEVSATNAIFGQSVGFTDWEIISWYLNNKLMYNTSCIQSKGWIMAVFNNKTGNPWVSEYPGQYGNFNCWGRERPTFEFRTNTTIDRQYFKDFVDVIPDSFYILAYNVKNLDVSIYDQDMKDHFYALGMDTAVMCDSSILKPEWPYIYFGQKGNVNWAGRKEVVGDSAAHIMTESGTFTTKWYEGSINSPIIGPAKKWENVIWKWVKHPDASLVGSADMTITAIGDGVPNLTINTQSTLFALDTIDAALYPYLQLNFHTKNDSDRKAGQLEHWRVTYTPMPEAALDGNSHLVFESEILNAGENMKFEIAVKNTSNIDMDSLLISYSLRNKSNKLEVVEYKKHPPLLAGEQMISKLSLNTLSYTGDNVLYLEVNPDEDQLEQHHFNNLAQLEFFVNKDKVNPLMDVTFDGKHIMDGEIVSASPDILIQLKDENQYLALDNDSLLNVIIHSPNGTINNYAYDGNILTFIPAEISTNGNGTINNSAMIEFRPEFTEDGIYRLQVSGKDKSSNPAGQLDYNITFEIINKPSITNIINYPNPFSTSTQFVFTLTGSEIPQNIKIQIMTVSGKVIREITRDELGSLRIGVNRTDFTWDGTDQYGDLLANGLYLYRVVTRLNDQDVEHRASGLDDYFHKGFGKMYIIR